MPRGRAGGARRRRHAAGPLTARQGAAARAAAVAVLALAALRLAVQVPRLVTGGPAVFGAVDLGFRHAEVARWLAGERVYGALDTAVYPPATYALLWPFLGWLISRRRVWSGP
ncbi:MAG TPA: hypothetical protein VF121_06260 [Thermoanaerobaculia bacterium]|nr:hypothetical protein [Thermoanaerobaculia bacterium]